MPDPADIAQEIIEQREAALLAAVPRYTGVAAHNCVECDAVIPEARRAALPGVQLCVLCAELNEARANFKR